MFFFLSDQYFTNQKINALVKKRSLADKCYNHFLKDNDLIKIKQNLLQNHMVDYSSFFPFSNLIQIIMRITDFQFYNNSCVFCYYIVQIYLLNRQKRNNFNKLFVKKLN